MANHGLGGSFSTARGAVEDVTISQLNGLAKAADGAGVFDLVDKAQLSFAEAAPAYSTLIKETEDHGDAVRIAHMAARHATTENTRANAGIERIVLNSLMQADMAEDLPGVAGLGDAKLLRDEAISAFELLQPAHAADVFDHVAPYAADLSLASKEVLAEGAMIAVENLDKRANRDTKVADRLLDHVAELTAIPGYDQAYAIATDQLFAHVSPKRKAAILDAKISGLMDAPAQEPVIGVLAQFGKKVDDFLSDEGTPRRTAREMLGLPPVDGQGSLFVPGGK